MNRAARWAATHRKAIVAAVGAAVTLAAGVWGTDNKYVALAILICTVLGVNGVPNRPAQVPPEPAPDQPEPPPRPRLTSRQSPPPPGRQVLWSGDMAGSGPFYSQALP